MKLPGSILIYLKRKASRKQWGRDKTSSSPLQKPVGWEYLSVRCRWLTRNNRINVWLYQPAAYAAWTLVLKHSSGSAAAPRTPTCFSTEASISNSLLFGSALVTRWFFFFPRSLQFLEAQYLCTASWVWLHVPVRNFLLATVCKLGGNFLLLLWPVYFPSNWMQIFIT